MTRRIMALDVGEKRIGVALSDPLGLTAQPLEKIERTSNRAAVARILEIVAAYDVGEIVVGMPYNTRGELSATGQAIARFADLLARAAPAPVTRWDERHTTATAEQVLLQADVSRAKRRQVIDQLAAAVLLQDYMEAHRRSGEISP